MSPVGGGEGAAAASDRTAQPTAVPRMGIRDWKASRHGLDGLPQACREQSAARSTCSAAFPSEQSAREHASPRSLRIDEHASPRLDFRGRQVEARPTAVRSSGANTRAGPRGGPSLTDAPIGSSGTSRDLMPQQHSDWLRRRNQLTARHCARPLERPPPNPPWRGNSSGRPKARP